VDLPEPGSPAIRTIMSGIVKEPRQGRLAKDAGGRSYFVPPPSATSVCDGAGVCGLS
jgi:hypothetical protein